MPRRARIAPGEIIYHEDRKGRHFHFTAIEKTGLQVDDAGATTDEFPVLITEDIRAWLAFAHDYSSGGH